MLTASASAVFAAVLDAGGLEQVMMTRTGRRALRGEGSHAENP
jgi:hypothetical protein